MTQAVVYKWKDMEPEQMNPMITRQYLTGAEAMLARVVLTKGCVVPTHSHPNEQIAFIVEGCLEFNVAGEIHTVRSGEVLVIPRDVPHSAVALEDTVDLDIFSPPRQDWIDGGDSYLR